jgi:hypothetical protein
MRIPDRPPRLAGYQAWRDTSRAPTRRGAPPVLDRTAARAAQRDRTGERVTGTGSRTRRGHRQLDRPRHRWAPWHERRHGGLLARALRRDRLPGEADGDADGRRWWWQTDIDAFYAAHLEVRAATFTEIDRTGHPRYVLTAPQAAKVLGYKNHHGLPDKLLPTRTRPTSYRATDSAPLVPGNRLGLRRRSCRECWTRRAAPVCLPIAQLRASGE